MRLLLFLLFVLVYSNIHSQYRLSGSLYDDTKNPLPYATVLVFKQADSSSVAHGVTDLNGRYQINIQENGAYRLKYSYMGFSDKIISLNIYEDSNDIEIQDMFLEHSPVELKTLNVISERVPVKIKGDTIQYNSESFKVSAGSDVEQLLEKLPGFEIDSEGNIMVHGKRVEKVLVDGKEFFGNDLKIATKNLEAEAIQFVEVTDKKSDEALFTGSEEDNEIKVVNLTLKAPYKTGAFGKASVGVGTEKTYQGKISCHRFNQNSRFSIIGHVNNVNERISPNLGAIKSYRFNALRGIASNEGIRSSLSPGLNLNQQLSEKVELQISYHYIEDQTKLVKGIASDNFSGDTTYQSYEDILMDEISKNHVIKTKLKWNPGTRTLVSLENDMVLFRKHFGGDSRFRYPDGMTNILSFTRNLSHTTSNGFGGLSRLSVTHKFKKEGRNVNLVGNLNAYQENNKSRIHNYLIGGEQYQTQNFNGNKRKWSIEGYFTEPINGFWNVRLGQQFFQENELQNRSSSTNEVIDSTDFQEGSGTIRTVTENKSSIDLSSTHKKVRYFMGVSVSDIQLKSLEVSRSFQFVLPKFSIKYYLKSAQYVKLNYHTNSVIPRLEQLIDAPDNTNLQRSYIGNPNLRPEYGHNLSLNYFYLNPIKAHNVFVGVQASQMNHKIMNQTTVNSDLTTRISAINLGTYQNIGVIGGISGPIKKLKVAYNISPNFSWSRSHILLNGQKVAVNTSSYFTDICIKRLKKDKWDYKIGASWNNNETRYPSERSMDRKIQSYSWYVNLEYEFFQGFIFKLDYKFRKFVTIISESETEFHYLNVRLKKTINRNWTLTVIANDILNQNTGIRTSSNLNQINTVQYNSINRYIMLAVEYKLRKNKTSKH